MAKSSGGSSAGGGRRGGEVEATMSVGQAKAVSTKNTGGKPNLDKKGKNKKRGK